MPMNAVPRKKLPHQIVYNGYINEDILDRLEQKSKETRCRVEIRCPACSGGAGKQRSSTQPTGCEDTSLSDEIQLINNTLLQCRACNTPIEIFQQRHLRTKAETRFVYIPSTGEQTKRIRFRMQCLSCDKNITTEGDCPLTCGIQTYLILAHEDGECYVKRWWNKPNIPREPMEIPIQKTIRLENVITSDHPPTLREQILALMHTDLHIDRGEKSTEYIIYAINANPSAIKKELTKAVEKGEIENVRYGYYRLPRKNHPNTTLVKTDSPQPQEAIEHRRLVKPESSHRSKTSIQNHETHGVHQRLNQPKTTHTPIPDPPNAHIDVAGQILAYLSEHQTGETQPMRKAIGCSPQGFKVAIDKLIKEGKLRRIKRGVYELINRI